MLQIRKALVASKKAAINIGKVILFPGFLVYKIIKTLGILLVDPKKGLMEIGCFFTAVFCVMKAALPDEFDPQLAVCILFIGLIIGAPLMIKYPVGMLTVLAIGVTAWFLCRLPIMISAYVAAMDSSLMENRVKAEHISTMGNLSISPEELIKVQAHANNVFANSTPEIRAKLQIADTLIKESAANNTKILKDKNFDEKVRQKVLTETNEQMGNMEECLAELNILPAPVKG